MKGREGNENAKQQERNLLLQTQYYIPVLVPETYHLSSL